MPTIGIGIGIGARGDLQVIPALRREYRQTVGDPPLVALRAGDAELPAGRDIATDAGPLWMDGAARIHPDLGIQRHAAWLPRPGALHHQPVPVENFGQFRRHPVSGMLV
ncbi:hypothetical protein ABB29_00345 [Pseudoxanthomonas dokdonensis]|uniref:Uncharacterized protein n=1 Tax=Pseudoxanthomonas dokdonensis TaxID=344882 RepID=A0A0R0CR07_9GAMM|nr:hypothetical protein ABB29_00345 [Pseudoxanthomonas dokdonensis]